MGSRPVPIPVVLLPGPDIAGAARSEFARRYAASMMRLNVALGRKAAVALVSSGR